MRPSTISHMRPTFGALMRPTPLAMMRPSPLVLTNTVKPASTKEAYRYDGPGPNHPKPWPVHVWMWGWTGYRVSPTLMWPLYDKLVYATLLVGFGIYQLQMTLIEKPQWRNSPDNPYREWQDARDAKLAGAVAH